MGQTVSRPKDATQSTMSSLAVPHKYRTDPGPHHIQAVALYRHYCPWTHCWRKWNAAEARARLVLLHLSVVKLFLNCAQRTNPMMGDTEGHPIYGAPTAHKERTQWWVTRKVILYMALLLRTKNEPNDGWHGRSSYIWRSYCAQRTNPMMGDTEGHPIYGAPTAHKERTQWWVTRKVILYMALLLRTKNEPNDGWHGRSSYIWRSYCAQRTNPMMGDTEGHPIYGAPTAHKERTQWWVTRKVILYMALLLRTKNEPNDGWHGRSSYIWRSYCAQRTNPMMGDTEGHPIYGAPTAHEERTQWWVTRKVILYMALLLRTKNPISL